MDDWIPKVKLKAIARIREKQPQDHGKDSTRVGQDLGIGEDRANDDKPGAFHEELIEMNDELRESIMTRKEPQLFLEALSMLINERYAGTELGDY